MEFGDVLKLRRSTRKFSNGDLTEAEIDAILAAGEAAPTGSALYKNVHLTVLRDRELIQALAGPAEERKKDPEVQKALAAAGVDLKARASQSSGPAFYGAPVVYIVSHRKLPAAPGITFCNAAIVAYTMHLAATDRGLGSVLIWGILEAVRLRPELGLYEKLGLPEDFEPLLGVVAGRYVEAPEPRDIPANRYAVLRK
jgi:nitroreductase